jgi:UDP-N-acetylmuramoyl-tripeptide--D-alanyl-D-alanine ligase
MDWVWTTETLAQILAWRLPANLPRISITSVQAIPDACSPGALFVPLPFQMKVRGLGSEAEAIATAIGYGASLALTTVPQLPGPLGAPVLRVAPPLIGTLVKLAQFARSRYRGKVIALTGSVGKTTTKDLLHHVLSTAGTSFKTPANHNSIGGVCTTLINRPLKNDFLVVEVAASRKGHLGHAGVARPHIGLVTNVGISHLVHYNDRKELFREKVSLFDHLEGDRIGIVHRSVLDADRNEGLIRAKGLSRLVTVGTEPDNDIYCSELNFDGVATTGNMSVFGKTHRFRLPLAGHFVDSAMFGMAVAAVLDLDMESALAALSTMVPSPRRCERHRIATEGGAMELIDDSFNAAPDSVSALLRILERRAAARKVFVFGDMKWLGAGTVQYHEAIAPLLARAGVDLLVTVGALARMAAGASRAAIHFPDADEAAAGLPALLKPGDLIAVKASQAVHLEKAVQAILAIGQSTPVTAWRIENELEQTDSAIMTPVEGSIPKVMPR